MKQYMTDRFGDFVLYKPPLEATTVALWVGPFAVLVLRRFYLPADSGNRASPGASAPPTPTVSVPVHYLATRLQRRLPRAVATPSKFRPDPSHEPQAIVLCRRHPHHHRRRALAARAAAARTPCKRRPRYGSWREVPALQIPMSRPCAWSWPRRDGSQLAC